MCVLETVAHKLAVHGAGLQAGGAGRPELSPCDVAGMLAGLGPGPVALAYAKFTLDDQAGRQLYAVLHVELAGMAARERWEIPRGSRWLEYLARMARDDLVLPRPLMSERAAAAWMSAHAPLSRRAWRETWRPRHGRLLELGAVWEWELRRKLGRELHAA